MLSRIRRVVNMQSKWRKNIPAPCGPRFTPYALLAPILLIGIAVSTNQALAWSKSADFESGTTGTIAAGPNAFNEAGVRTTFSNQRAHSGSQSAKMEWKQGDEGFSNDRGTLLFPSTVKVGQEIWGRAYFYFEAPWSWASATTANCGCVQKVFRFKKIKGDGSNGGFISIYGTKTGDPRGDCEFCNLSRWNLWQNKNLPKTVLGSGQWYSLEQYVYFHPTNGIYRMWIDGVLKVEDLNIDTANASDTTMTFSFLMSFWNGGVSQDQTQYIDDIFITTDTPADRDAEGNPMIGPGPFVPPDTNPPLPPSGLTIQ